VRAWARVPFPCLDGVRYTGCLGLACPLERCWTGAATVSDAYRRARVSTALYLPGAPCHGCACLAEDIVPAAGRRPAHHVPATDASGHAATESNDVPNPSRSDDAVPGGEDDGERAECGEQGARRRITCARGLWAHPISLSSFVTKRIPMRDQDEPEACPGYEPRADGEPHPAIATHLRRRRERARHLRERASGQGS